MAIGTLTIILAGGKGTRLEPLTRERAKPAVPFGGGYRVIDVSMSNCVNSGLFQLLVLPQYKSLSLDRHLELAWKPLFQRELGAYLDVMPPQQRIADEWYRGTADAVYQNIYSIDQAGSEDVLILAGDHIYAMDYREMIAYHRAQRADVTIGASRATIADAANQFGVVQVDCSQRVVGFQEKPPQPAPIPGDSAHALASMGIYLFRTAFLEETLCANAAMNNGGHDFGHHILPAIIGKSRVFAFPLRSRNGAAAYWKDVGTLDAYFEAHQDLLKSDSPFRLDDERWPIRTFNPNLAPPVFLSEVGDAARGCIYDSIVCAGSKLVSAAISRSVLGYKSRISPGARIEDCILLGDVTIGRDVQLRRTIVDKHVRIPDGMQIGLSRRMDEDRGFTVSPGGITVVPRGFQGNERESAQRHSGRVSFPISERQLAPLAVG